jgi:mannose-6-phosphate isomerase-like protein (cupin superfamily)
VRVKDEGLEGLEQTVLVCAPDTSTSRTTGDFEEVLFVVAGQGELHLPGGERHPLEPETGVNLGPGQEYELRNETSDPMRIVCVRIRGSAPLDGGDPARTMIRRLADQEAQNATSEREFQIVADPSTGLRSATHFVGYVPTVRAPDHFHTYDEVIYVLEGEGFLEIDGERAPLRAGSCVHLPARLVHCLANTGDSELRLLGVFRPAGSPAEAYYPDGTPAVRTPPKEK